MFGFRNRGLFRVVLLLCVVACAAQALRAATQSFTIKGTDVKLSGQGSGQSTFTIKSVNGLAGQIGVTCSGPPPLGLVLPDCEQPDVLVNVVANGTATGTMGFRPPWTTVARDSRNGRNAPGRELPMAATLAGGIGLLSLRLRYRSSHTRMLAIAASLSLLAGLTGCVGKGGLAMTPGTYTYSLSASGMGSSANTTILVTVKCDSCP